MICDYLAGKILMGLFMLVCAALDFRENRIDIRIFIGMFFAEICGYVGMWLCGFRIDIVSIITGIAVGIAVLIISLLTGGSIGIGDGVFFALTGIAIGGMMNFLLLVSGIAVSAFAGLFIVVKKMIAGKRAGIRDESFAFLPLVFPVGILMLFLV